MPPQAAHNTAPTSPCCPTSYVTKLAADGSSYLCMGCARRIPAYELKDESELSEGQRRRLVEDLMRAPCSTDHTGGSGRAKSRRQMKPGEKQWLAERSRSHRYEQQAGFGGPRDRESDPMRKKVCLPMDDGLATAVDTMAKAEKVSVQEFIREALRQRIAGAAALTHTQQAASA